jgi:hypothetical protein
LGKLQGRLERELTLFIRQMAWLHVTPKPPAGSKRAQAAVQVSEISRIDKIRKDGGTPQMPPNPMPHIISRLVEIGLTEPNAGGIGPISWQTIAAWQRMTGVVLPAWEARLLRRLSLAYVTESRIAEEETCPAPFRIEVTQKELEVAEANLRMVLG